MAGIVEKKETPERRKRQYSSELLQPPKGPGVAFLARELEVKCRKRTCLSSKLMCDQPKTFKVEKSSVLGRVQLFLPQLKDADRQLKERLRSHDPDDLDIENVEEDEPCVEMDLAVVPLFPESDSASSCSDSDSEQSEREVQVDTVNKNSSIISDDH